MNQKKSKSAYSSAIKRASMACMAVLFASAAYLAVLTPAQPASAGRTTAPDCSSYTTTPYYLNQSGSGATTFFYDRRSPMKVPYGGECKNINLVLTSIKGTDCAKFRIRFYPQPAGSAPVYATNWRMMCKSFADGKDYMHAPLATDVINGTIYRVETDKKIEYKIYH
jgi:hypothetical protein